MARELKYYNDSYQGSLIDEQCKALEYYIELNNQKGTEAQLTHCIKEMSNDEASQLIYDYESFGVPSRQYETPVGTLLDYQTIGVAFAFHAGNYINGDSVGMGKTVETAGFYNVMTKYYESQNAINPYRMLVLTEKNLVNQFRFEMVKFTGQFFRRIPNAENREVSDFILNNPADLPLKASVIGTHALIKSNEFIAWLEQCRANNNFPFHTLVVDESSVLGGKSTNLIVKAFKLLSKHFKKIIFLNATPFESHLEIFYNQLALLDPKLLPAKTVFQEQYCEMRWMGNYKRPTGKYKNTDRFKQLIKFHYFARTRKDRGAQMTNCKGGVIMSELSPIQKEWLHKTQMYKCVFDCPNVLSEDIEFNETNVPKLASLMNLIENEAADEPSILIFTYYKEAQRSLSLYLDGRDITHEILNGETKQADRERIIDEFKQNKFRVLITNVQKGLNFGNCGFLVFYSIDPNPSKMIQFEGRITRALDIENKTVYVLCSRGKEEKSLLATVKARAKAATELTNTDISVLLDILLGGEADEA